MISILGYSCSINLSWQKDMTPEVIDTNWCLSYANMISGNIFFVNRLVKLWNTLPDDVVSACSVNSFKRRLDLIWHGFSLYYDYKSDI